MIRSINVHQILPTGSFKLHSTVKRVLDSFIIDDINSYSPTALGRETSQHDCEAKAGNFLAKTQTNIG